VKDDKRDSRIAKEWKRAALLPKRTFSGDGPPSAPIATATETSDLWASQNVFEQIGTPDYHGWLHKRAESYNNWKRRYFVLKGPHLYWMKSDDRTVGALLHAICAFGNSIVAGDEDQRLPEYLRV
jgi:hypothetical protein